MKSNYSSPCIFSCGLFFILLTAGCIYAFDEIINLLEAIQREVVHFEMSFRKV